MSKENQEAIPRKGWADKWHNSESEIKSVRQEFVLPLKDIDPSEYQGVKIQPTEKGQFGDLRISVVPTPAELARAPKSVRRVLKDIGVSVEDPLTVSLVVYENAPMIGLRIVPDVIDEKHVGLEITNREFPQAIIERRIKQLNVEGEEEAVIMETALYPDETEIDRLNSTRGSLEANRIRVAYAGFSGNFDGFNSRTISSPYTAKIVTKGAKWVSELVESRRIPAPTLQGVVS